MAILAMLEHGQDARGTLNAAAQLLAESPWFFDRMILNREHSPHPEPQSGAATRTTPRCF
jgi:hypothetical protein